VRNLAYLSTKGLPNLNKKDERVPISSVVLGSQRADVRQTLFDAAMAEERQK
jgi:hypothetical protein